MSAKREIDPTLLEGRLEALDGLDEARVYFAHAEKPKCWVFFVFGNGDDCVVADSSGNFPDGVY